MLTRLWSTKSEALFLFVFFCTFGYLLMSLPSEETGVTVARALGHAMPYTGLYLAVLGLNTRSHRFWAFSTLFCLVLGAVIYLVTCAAIGAFTVSAATYSLKMILTLGAYFLPTYIVMSMVIAFYSRKK